MRVFKIAFVFCLLGSFLSQGQTLPQYFSREVVGGVGAAAAITTPSVLAFAPDGRIFVGQQGGALRIIKNDVLLTAPFVSLTVNSSGERGLLGIAFDPDFATNNYIYLYYTVAAAPIHNRISRFTANGDVVVPASEVIILELDNLTAATNHNGGAIAFGPDGKLYVAIGENATPANAQSLTTYHGKFLRINKDGSAPLDNPFPSAASEQQRRVWSYGLRNPFTFAIQPGTGRIFVNDVGQGTWEEINDATQADRNFGWPATEGATSNPLYTTPVFAYNSSGAALCAITGGTFYNPTVGEYPLTYVGKYFFQDLCSEQIFWIDPTVSSPASTVFGSTVGGQSLGLTVGTDGNLYYLSRSASRLYRIVYNPPAPVIDTQPDGATVLTGQTITLTVAATGAADLSYQWQKDGTDIAGATAATLMISNAALSHAGDYTVTVTNPGGSVTSNEATVVVSPAPVAPSITEDPEGLTVEVGQPATFSVTATGTAPLSYQWQKDEVDINGATESSFTISITVLADAGLYRAVVTNGIGSATSDEAELQVVPANQPPAITEGPEAAAVEAGQQVSFSVAATGSAPLTYQWQKDEGDINGATASTFTIPVTALADAGMYRVVVSNIAGTATSDEVELEVLPPNQPPTAVITLPTSVSTYRAGTTIQFAGTGTDPEDGSLPAASFAWSINFHHGTHYHDQPPIEDITFGSFDIPDRGETASDVWYRFILTVTDSKGATSVASIDVLPEKSTLTFATVPSGLGITLEGQPLATPSSIESVVGLQRDISAPALHQLNGTNYEFSYWLSGGPRSQTIITPEDDASYVAIYNAIGPTPPVPPGIIVEPIPITVDLGQAATFSVTATGAAPLSYQWQKGGVDISGATQSTFAIAVTALSDAGLYRVIVSNTAGTDTSHEVELQVLSFPPVITDEPEAISLNLGQPALLSIIAIGTAPLSYQWQRDGVDITGATQSTFSIASTALTDAGMYRVIVSNAAGNATSDEVELHLNQAPSAVITVPAEGSTYRAGETIEFAGTGTDREDGDLPASSFEWVVNFHHDTHAHDQPPSQGIASGNFDVPDRGETSPNVWYEFVLTVTDSEGLKSVASVDVLPETSIINFSTQPAGLEITLDGQPLATPASITSVVGLQRDIGAAAVQELDGSEFRFMRWSSGGDRVQTIVTPESDATISAIYAIVLSAGESGEQPQIFPNPARDYLIIPGDATSARAVDVLGRSFDLKKLHGGEQSAFDVSELSPGVYFVRGVFAHGGKMAAQRIVIAK